MSVSQTRKIRETRSAILEAALTHVAFDGWSSGVLLRAADALGMERGEALLAFPDGVTDLVDTFFEEGDRRMLEILEATDLEGMKIRERIAFAVKTRIEADSEHREAVRRAVAFCALPVNGASGLKALYRTVDAIWLATGDQSTDFSFYTRRLLLAGVFVSTQMIWINDNSAGFQKSRAFLQRRIEDVMKIEKGKARLMPVLDALPNPVSLFAWLRYPRLR